MKLYHPFPPDVRNEFLWHQFCFKCGQNGTATGGLELHHITGRGKFEKFKDSIFNACPLCKKCHDSILHNPETHFKLTVAVFRFLKDIRYQIKEYDKNYLLENRNDFGEFFGRLVYILKDLVK